MRRFFVVPLLAAVMFLSACGAQMNQMNKEFGGTLVGAGLGGLLGSQIGSGTGQLVAVAIGTLSGAMVGGEVGKSLDRADRLYAERAAQQALETAPVGNRVVWQNPTSGHSGWTAPVRTYERRGTPCREYQTTVTVGGRDVQGYGTACRQADGSWRIMNDSSSVRPMTNPTSRYVAPSRFIRQAAPASPRVVYVRPYEGRERCYDSSYNRRSRHVSGQTIYKVFTGDIRPWERSRVYGSLIPSISKSSSTSCHRTYYR